MVMHAQCDKLIYFEMYHLNHSDRKKDRGGTKLKSNYNIRNEIEKSISLGTEINTHSNINYQISN